jgi:ABC-type spermidine/putrescine transport system permease subunit II/DNA-binding beta-propeller fold protein YncE
MVGALSVGLPLAQIALANRTWAELPGAVEAGTGAIWNSFWFAALAATIVVGLGLLVTNRTHVRTHGAGRLPYLGIVAWLPFFIPGVLLGIALIKVFNRPVIAAFYQSAGIVVLAFVIRYFAVGWTATRHAIGSVDSDLTDAAKLEGATGWQLLRFVHWPQIAPQVFAAWYVVYLLCLWDVESMVLVVPPGGETLALRIFNLLHYGHNAQVNALCLALLALAVMPLAVGAAYEAWRVAGRKRDAAVALAGVIAIGLTGCSPQSPSNEAPLNSQFFDRVQIIGTRGTGVGQFNKPRSVAVDKQDNLYVVDMTGRVQKFSPDGKSILSWQMPQTDLGKPKGMSCDKDGNIIVIEPHYQRVNHFSPDGKLVRQWGTHGTNDGQLTLPRSVAVDSRGEILVSEYTVVDRVQRFSLPITESTFNIQHSTSNVQRSPLTLARSTSAEERENTSPTRAEWLGSFGQPGTGNGDFNRAEGLGIDVADRIYVADSCNHRVQVFSPEGKWLRSYGKAGSGRGEFSYPYDVRVDAAGMQFVCEFGNSRVQIFDALDRPVEVLGKSGFAPGQFSTPWAIALDSQGNLYVADAGNHRVQKFVRRENVAAHTRRRFGSLPTAMAQEKSDCRLTLAATQPE